MARQKKENVDSRNVKLAIETYDRLEKYVVDLISQRGVRKVTMNDAISELLAEHYNQKRNQKKVK
jgi:hypothetical protein